MKNITLNDKAEKDFLTYAKAVIKSRAISNVEDNLKPVHRRILYAMDSLGLDANKKPKKSARVVGDVIGKYHPHGDFSVYNAMIRMAQPWKMRYPLIEVQGNMGNIDGDKAAAMRYTEAKLSKIGELMLKDIHKNAVPFRSNYDDSDTEPIHLPSVFPNILCNGNSGIAVGMSTDMVPHNLVEVIDAIRLYLDFKQVSIADLMKFIKGPDFPTGGIIADGDKLLEIYETGSGTITLRGKYKIEKAGGKTSIIFTEIPYLVKIEEGIIEPLKKLVNDDGFDLIEDFENNTDKNGINLKIILAKGANVYRVLETLWKNTRLQVTQRINNTILVNKKAKVLNLKQMIEHYINHRHNVIINVSQTDLEKTEKRIHSVEALISALSKIDQVIELIKKSKDNNEAGTEIMKLLGVDRGQANTILDMKLSRLNKIDSEKLKSELTNLQEKEKVLQGLVSDKKKRENQIRFELAEIRNKFGDERRTTIAAMSQDAAEGMPIEPVKVLIFENGSIFTTQKEIKDLNFKTKKSPLNFSRVAAYLELKTNEEMVVFTNDGVMHRLAALTLNKENIEEGFFAGVPLAAIRAKDMDNYTDIVFFTSGGLVKKTDVEEYKKLKTGARTIKLKGDQELIAVGFAAKDSYIAILGEKLSYYKASEIRRTSKLTIGSKGISDSKVYSAIVLNKNEKFFSITKDGKAKLTNASDLVENAKGSSGQVIADNTVIITNASKSYIGFDGNKNHFLEKRLAVKSKNSIGSLFLSDPVSVVPL